MEMRTNASFTQEEVTNVVRWAALFDAPMDSTPAGVENQTLIRDYFIRDWKEDATPENLATATEQLKPHLKHGDPAEAAGIHTYFSNLLGYEKEEAQAWVAPKAL